MRCNGDWEHQHQIIIKSQDNPGWRVEIDLKDTPWEDASFKGIRMMVGESDWMICAKRESQFLGAGDASKLEAIMAYFLSEVGG